MNKTVYNAPDENKGVNVGKEFLKNGMLDMNA